MPKGFQSLHPVKLSKCAKTWLDIIFTETASVIEYLKSIPQCRMLSLELERHTWFWSCQSNKSHYVFKFEIVQRTGYSMLSFTGFDEFLPTHDNLDV